MKNCSACTHEARDDFLECIKCNAIFHLLCLNIEPKTCNPSTNINWICPQCMSKQPRGDNSECLVRPSTPTSMAEFSFNVARRRKAPSTMTTQSDSLSANTSCNTNEYIRRSELRDLIRDEMSNVLNSYNLDIKSNFNSISDQLKDFRSSLDFMSDKFDKISESFQQQQRELLYLKKENISLRSEIDSLSYKLNQLDQLTRSSTLEIQCIPEKKTENVVQVTKQLGRVINCNLNDNDILYCSRVAKLNPNSTRPRTIVVKLSSPRLRDSMLSSVTRYNKEHAEDKLNTHDLGFVDEKKIPVFVIENLSFENKQLHAATRQRGKELKYKFVWIRAGRIFMRKNESSPAVLIRNLSELAKLQ